MKQFIVVPEGLAVDAEGNFHPSDHYMAALELAMALAEPGDRIYLAPANSFGAHQEEDHFAQDYLKGRNCKAEIRLISDDIRRDQYLDTLDNAVYLRRDLKQKGEWPMLPVTLICNRPHKLRSSLMFRLCGYNVVETVTSTATQRTGRKMVERLWFYDVPVVQYFYELAATVYNGCRFIFLKD
jgi:uncharacterized SAM-binding protein YcdF (DUF218 family)